MVMSQAAVLDLVGTELFPGWEKEYDRLCEIDRWYRREQREIRLPRRATREMRELAAISKTPWLGLVVKTLCQTLFVDGYRSDTNTSGGDVPTGEVTAPTGPWRTWCANDMEHRQLAVHRATAAYGYAFTRVLPGKDPSGRKTSVIRGVSPRKAWAVYEDPSDDDWPMYVLEVEKQPNKSYLLTLYDEEILYRVGMESLSSKPEFIDFQEHGAQVVPFVRYTNQIDLEGRCDGEVEPFIPMAARINKTAFDRMMAQHFGSWKVRTVAGMAKPADEEEARREKLRLRQDDLLVAEDPDTKFGTLDETPLEPLIGAEKQDIATLAAVTQTPTYALTGDLINLSAEALAMARSSLTQKSGEMKVGLGKSHVQTLRLAAALEGDQIAADDVMARVTWQDTDVRSLAQAVDALGKMAKMLHVPVEALWARIPGTTKTDVDEWRQLLLENDPITQLQEQLDRQSDSTMPDGL